MGGELQWVALDGICELLGIRDVEWLITQLCAIRDYQRSQQD